MPTATSGFVTSDDLGDGAAFAAWERPATGLAADQPRQVSEPDAIESAPDMERIEHFYVGDAPTPVADYLFVIDDSISMWKVLDRYRAGIAGMTEPGVFPSGARIAVMNTTPADPQDRATPHPDVLAVAGEAHLPGFLRLISRDRIRDYRQVVPGKLRRRFSQPGCSAWFAPDQSNTRGDPCLWAHSQIGLHHSRVEAGLIAVKQWLDETVGEQRFRDGAAVNVVFISDTHDPGVPPNQPERWDRLLDLQPDLTDIAALIDEPIASLRVHAIAPEEECAERFDDPSYFRVARESGGVTADVCELTDYAPVIDAIAKTGARQQRPVVRLGFAPDRVEEVLLDGDPVDWERIGQAVVLDQRAQGLLSVRYQVE